MSVQLSHELKLDRASYHLNSLDAKVREWSERETHRYVSHTDRESGKQYVYIRFTQPIPAELRLIIGDCLHHPPSTLDNFVYDLVIARHGDPPPPQFVGYSEFPIFGPKAISFSARRKRIGGIDPNAQAIIEGLQPHNRGNAFASDPLWKLHQLSNMDKHRVPHVVQMAISSFADFTDAPHLPGTININIGSYEDGAEIATYTPRSSAFAEGFDPKMHMAPLLTFGIAFGQGSATPGWSCGLTLRWLHNHIVNKVLPDLVPYLA